jgi:hypothetical protein
LLEHTPPNFEAAAKGLKEHDQNLLTVAEDVQANQRMLLSKV